jgi:LAGLIDADG endonuclease
LSGFISGEGNFFVNIFKSKIKVGETVKLSFRITQHSRDELLLKNFIQIFGCGKVYVRSNQTTVDFVVEKFSDIYEKIIPFFKKYPIEGVKAGRAQRALQEAPAAPPALDFSDFVEVAELMKNKKHLTKEGLEKIQNIKTRMNKNRIFNDDDFQ